MRSWPACLEHLDRRMKNTLRICGFRRGKCARTGTSRITRGRWEERDLVRVRTLPASGLANTITRHVFSASSMDRRHIHGFCRAQKTWPKCQWAVPGASSSKMTNVRTCTFFFQTPGTIFMHACPPKAPLSLALFDRNGFPRRLTSRRRAQDR